MSDKQTLDLIILMIENLTTQIKDMDKKLSYKVDETHKRINDHLTSECNVEKNLKGHLENHKFEITRKQWTVGQIVVVICCLFTSVVAIWAAGQ
jgi:hypothetical protein